MASLFSSQIAGRKILAVTKFLIIFSLVVISLLKVFTPALSNDSTELLWDSWGVPHVYAQDQSSLFKAFGWAQTQNHGDLILRLYGQARGRAAEYWGEKYLSSDRYVRTMGIPSRAKQWYREQSSQMQKNLDAFAEGINTYVQKNPDQIDDDVKAVLPISGVDILAHVQRVLHFHFVVNPQQITAFNPEQPLNKSFDLGSNAWAIAPSKTASGNALLLANPHLPWSDLYTMFEAQLQAPGVDAYGATLVGMPFLVIAFNDYLGWTLTVNTFDGADTYELTLAEDGYLWEGKVRAFEEQTETMLVKQAEGKYKQETLVVKSSVHGPVISENDHKAYALRVTGLGRSQILSQYWQMARAKNLQQFEAALQTLQLPMFNILYSDRQGQIFYLFNAVLPMRNGENWDYWQGVIPGDTAETLWQKYHAYQDLPRLLNPSNGWLQNANDPPWTSTFPRLLTPQNYPSYLAPANLGKTDNIFRPQRSIKMLQESGVIDLEEAIALKFSTRLELAERLLDDLIEAARNLATPLSLETADVLQAWDRQANADSKGAVLFALWALSLNSESFATPWQNASPLITPDGIADIDTALATLETVAAQVELFYGTIDVSWGEVVRLKYAQQDLPASGAPGNLGSFRVLYPLPTDNQHFRIVAGDSYIAAVEFADPVQAKVLTVYGNATQPGSPHVGDQLPLYAGAQLRPAWRTRQEVKAHLESQQSF